MRLTRSERQERTRSELVAAASAVFRARGFHAATLEEIAEAAGYSKGAVYSNFAGKDDLFVAVLDARYAGILDKHRDRMSRAASAPAALRAAAAQLAEDARADPGWAPVMIEFWTYATRDERMRAEIAARHERQLDEVAGLLGEVARRFDLQPSRPLREIARHGNALQRGIALERLLGSSPRPEVFEDAFVNLVLGFFRAKEAAHGPERPDGLSADGT
jgi:AcrR family transcriptional regulator